MVHQNNPEMAPDSDFELGEPSHLLEGNEGRLLDSRRTPIRICAIYIETGQFEHEILDFEDRGTRWVVPFEHVNHYQFIKGSKRQTKLKLLLEAIKNFDHPLCIPAAKRPQLNFSALREKAATYLTDFSIDLTADVGNKNIWTALQNYMEALDIADIENEFATQFVSNPYSGELVKGHRLVFADLGLVAFEGKVVRDPTIFDGRWSRTRREKHICARLAFIREMFAHAGISKVHLWRGISTSTSLEIAKNQTFVSTSFSRNVAESLFNGSDNTRVAVLMRQVVPIERIFMTYIETEAMNLQFLEAEAILIFDAENLAF